MTRKRPGGLSDEDRKLWNRVRESTVPLHPARRRTSPGFAGETPAPTPAPAEPPARAAIAGFRIGEAAQSTGGRKSSSASMADAAARRPVNMDARTFERLRRGRLAPQARLDLHGKTLAEARPALAGFVLSAQARGLRLVLVITGKGRDRDSGGPIPERRGILREHVPQWLAATPLKAAVVQVTEAHRRHGGGGAFYVYLRRRR